MKKLICNQTTIKLAEREMMLSLKECYLTIQHALFSFLKEANEEKRIEISNLIKQVGETYANRK